MPELLIKSRFVHSISRPDGWGVYHSLLGNLVLMDTAGKDFLDSFTNAMSLADAAAHFSFFNTSQIDSFANLLVSKGFLIEAGADDYSLIEEDQQHRQAHLHTGYLVRAMQLVTINSCNYKCKYCFMDMQAEARSAGREPGGEAMSIEVAEQSVRAMLDLLRSNGNNMLYLEFFGGEPLMNWPAIQHVLRTFGTQPSADVAINYSITTNGSLITQEMADLFRQNGVTVTISVDISAKMTGLPLVMAKTGDRIRRPLSILREAGNLVTFNSVISKETIQHFDGQRLVDLAKEYGVGVIGLILDLDLAFYRVPENRERALQILLDTHQYGDKHGVRVAGYWHQIFSQIIGDQPINLRSGYKTCPATGVKLSVEPDGSIFTCKCTSSPMGRLSDLNKILHSDEYANSAMRAYRNAPECEGCEIEGFCSGVCMGSYENEFGRKDMVETGACDIFRKVTRTLIARAPASRMPQLYLREGATF